MQGESIHMSELLNFKSKRSIIAIHDNCMFYECTNRIPGTSIMIKVHKLESIEKLPGTPETVI